MTENKRFKTGAMIQDYPIGVIMDLEHCKKLIEKYGSTEDINLMITDNGKNITYKQVTNLLNQLTNENEQLKQQIKGNEKMTKKRYTLEHENGTVYTFNDYTEGSTTSLQLNNPTTEIIEEIIEKLNQYEKQIKKREIKINKYEIVNDNNIYGTKNGKSIGIQDNKNNTIIASFDTTNKETNMKLAKIILNELNTGKYEED